MKQLLLSCMLLLTIMVSACISNFQKGLVAYNRGDNSTAVFRFEFAASQGDADAQYYLGLMSQSGIMGMHHDDVEALKWFRLGADQGQILAQISLGVMYADGPSMPHNYIEAVQELPFELQHKGNLAHGIDVPQDYAKAVKWFRLAANQGHAGAKKALKALKPKLAPQSRTKPSPPTPSAVAQPVTGPAPTSSYSGDYQKGIAAYYRGDFDTALREFRTLAEQGHPKAQYYLGLIYTKGQGVPKNGAEAVKWFSKATEQGLAEAQYNLGVMYNKGLGVSRDYAKAVKLFRTLAEQGHPKAQYNLGVMYYKSQGVSQDYAEAVKWFSKATERGFAEAQYNLGIMYESGQGVSRDHAKAVKWFRKAAEQGYASAQYNLGLKYGKGQGVPQKYTEAYFWFSLAAQQGTKISTRNRRLAKNKLTSGQISAVDKRVAAWRPVKHVQPKTTLAPAPTRVETIDFSPPPDISRNVKDLYNTNRLKEIRKAAEKGDVIAQNNLGVLFATGKGVVPKDYAEAYFWYSLAAKQATGNGSKALARARARLSQKQIADVDKRVAAWQSNSQVPPKPTKRIKIPTVVSPQPEKPVESQVGDETVEKKLETIKRLLDRGLITEEEAAAKRSKLLEGL